LVALSPEQFVSGCDQQVARLVSRHVMYILVGTIAAVKARVPRQCWSSLAQPGFPRARKTPLLRCTRARSPLS
jgi:hypothetical protein